MILQPGIWFHVRSRQGVYFLIIPYTPWSRPRLSVRLRIQAAAHLCRYYVMYQQLCGYPDTADWYTGSDALKGGAPLSAAFKTGKTLAVVSACHSI